MAHTLVGLALAAAIVVLGTVIGGVVSEPRKCNSGFTPPISMKREI